MDESLEEIEYFEIDGKEYMIAGEIDDNSMIYYFLINLNDKKDFMIQKAMASNAETLLPLDNEYEFNRTINLFKDKLIQNLGF